MNVTLTTEEANQVRAAVADKTEPVIEALRSGLIHNLATAVTATYEQPSSPPPSPKTERR